MKKKPQHLFTVFGLDVNLSSVLTTVIGFISTLLISAGLSWLHDIKTALKTDLPQLKTDVAQIQKEQQRYKREYAPELKK